MQNFEKFIRAANLKRVSIVTYPATKEAQIIAKALLDEIINGGEVSRRNTLTPNTAGTLIKKDSSNVCF